MALPKIPAPIEDVIPYLATSKGNMQEAMEPYRAYESALREVYAQDRDNPVLDASNVNIVPIFAGHEKKFVTHARDLDAESQDVKDKYMLTLPDEDRRMDQAPAITDSLKGFKTNFNVFSESSLVDLDWDNVVVAGSAAVTSLLPVPKEHAGSKRALRAYYHELLAPASDVDLFLYGIQDEEAAKKKIDEIEKAIRDSILYETTTIRTKYAITIASQHPCRHVQIVLRLYKNLSEILTSFDVDSACVAYDGKQVYATPRAISAFMTQTNVTDLSRRSPSYENRLSKYSRRGFEVYCPTLDRSRVDPTIFERSFGRVLGLARLLVLEKLPTKNDRERYITKRREERGRPALPWRFTGGLFGNIKDEQPDEVAEWDIEQEDVSNYHTFTVPYGPKFYAKKIEKLLFTKDLLLNAEWNKPKDRTVNLHRHPAFFGTAHDVFGDCCGFCPEPADEDEVLLAEKEAEIYIKGPIKFIVDNPGRQQIGSFNPLTEDDWTELAYVNSTGRLCQAIADGEIDHVKNWCEQPDADVNCRDHTGRTPLQLATLCSTPAVVQCLIDAGARITARLYDGKTALHIAAQRGDVAMVKALILQSEKNEEEEGWRQDKRKERVRAERQEVVAKDESEGSEEELSDGSEDDGDDEMTQGSYVRVKSEKSAQEEEENAVDEDELPDYFDANVLAWDYGASPLHLAIIFGHIGVVRELVDNFGSDVLLPIKVKDAYSNDPKAAILTLALAARFSPNSSEMAKELLQRGASSSQADMDEVSALHYVVHGGNQTVFDMLLEYDAPAAKAAINHVVVSGSSYWVSVRTPLLTAIYQRDFEMAKKLLDNGASVTVPYDAFVSAYHRQMSGAKKDYEYMKSVYEGQIHQPIVSAIEADLPRIAQLLVERGADVNTLTPDAHVSLQKEVSYSFSRQANPMRARSILEVAKFRQKKLGEATESGGPIPEITALKDDSYYMDGSEPSTYREWAARTDLERARHVLKTLGTTRDQEVENQEKAADKNASEMKDAYAGFAELIDLLAEKGAKTFDEIHPESEVDRSVNRTQHGYYRSHRQKFEGPYETKFDFQVPDLSGPRRQAYIVLFEAAWSGDTERVKSLTLSTWSPELVGASSEGTKSSGIDPLLISAQDSRGFSPLAIAIARGHMELADVMLDIAMVQYQPDDRNRKYRYTLEDLDEQQSDDRSEVSVGSGRDDDITVHKHLIDKKYTVDNVAALKDTVGSKTTPRTMIGETAQWFRFLDSFDEAKRVGIATPGSDLSTDWNSEFEKYSQGHLCAVLKHGRNQTKSSMFEFAILKNNLSLLQWLMDREAKYLRLEETNEEETNLFKLNGINRFQMNVCMRLGRTEMIGEIIKRTGIRLPLKSMVEKSGIEVTEKPKFYQGLTVYGRKRKDWADRSRGVFNHLDTGIDTPPLLDAAFNGTVETVEYFLGDAPLRRYEEFIEKHHTDASLEALRKERGGTSRAVSRWLNTRSQLALHGAVMAPPDRSREKLEFLIQSTPHNIDGLNIHRMTPLLLAFRYHRFDAARLLIKANANQAARDDRARNMLHQFMMVGDQGRQSNYMKLAFEAFIKLLDPTLPQELLTQRTSADTDSHTPLSYYIRHASQHKPGDFLESILHHSKGKDLELMDSTGDYPLHFVVRQGMSWAVKVFVKYNPALLYRENAVGLTPLDVAEIASLNQRIENFTKLPHQYGDPNNQSLTSTRGYHHQLRDKGFDKMARTRKVCSQAVAQHPGPRKLVSLFDANEVAKRLAANAKPQQKRTPSAIAAAQKYDYNQTVEEEKMDEVDDWSRSATRWKSTDLLKHLGLDDDAKVRDRSSSSGSG